MTPASRTPLVSVCVPTYNGAEYFDACLDGLLAQGLRDIEVLVGDDLSTDDTLEIARRRGDPRLRILPFQTRAGMSRNWSRCIAEARGKYVALVAQDDLVLPQWGERLVQLLESHPEADLAFGRRKFGIEDDRSRATIGEFFETKYPAILARFYARIETVIPSEVMIDAALEHRFEVNLIGEPSFTMFRRDHPATREGYHPEMKQLIDWEFAARFFLVGPILHCPEELGTYRLHAAGSSIGNSPLDLQHREYRLLMDSVLSRSSSRLSEVQATFLRERRSERLDAISAQVQELLAHARIRDSERAQLLAHARVLEVERSHLRGHANTLESEREQLLAHVRTLEVEREHLRGHVQTLEKILRKIHGMQTYRFLCRIKDLFGVRKAR
ncbi:MAG: glycosyltransferase [Planctomycetota bacterium]|nr:glycosyltransferase [Planctomycetota bacterium]